MPKVTQKNSIPVERVEESESRNPSAVDSVVSERSSAPNNDGNEVPDAGYHQPNAAVEKEQGGNDPPDSIGADLKEKKGILNVAKASGQKKIVSKSKDSNTITYTPLTREIRSDGQSTSFCRRNDAGLQNYQIVQ